jgi:hypothetical protein
VDAVGLSTTPRDLLRERMPRGSLKIVHLGIDPSLRTLRPPPNADEQVVLARAARRAEDAGDFAGARRLVRTLPPTPERRRWLVSLDAVLALGSEPAAGDLAAWLLQPALRFAVESTRFAVLLGFADEVLRSWGLTAPERAARLAAEPVVDPLVVDAALFDGGILAAYLGKGLAPALRRRAAPIETWPGGPPAVIEVVGLEGGPVRVRGVLDERDQLVAPFPDAGLGGFRYGRLVAQPGDPSVRFALPPVRLNRITARRVARAVIRSAPVEERLRAIASQRRGLGPP